MLPRGDDTSVGGAFKKDRPGKDIIWVQCDNCKTWYHFSCVREESANNLKGWACPPCEKLSRYMLNKNIIFFRANMISTWHGHPRQWAQQRSARQILPYDLPTLNGNPDEWPTFISAFESSTSAAGFSNVENMLRLQKSLRESIRSSPRQALVANHGSQGYKHIENILWLSRSNSGSPNWES